MSHRKRTRFCICVGLIVFHLLALTDIHAQDLVGTSIINKSDLIRFANERNEAWNRDFQKALSLSEKYNFPSSYVDERGRMVRLQRLGYHKLPIYYVTDNVEAAGVISTDQLWTDEEGQTWLTGEGFEVNLWDGGAILGTHQEFQDGSESRILVRDKDVAVSNHSTHIAGTIGAAGVDALARGMANRVTITGWDYDNDITEMSFMASEGIRLSNHSYGSLCGWDYNGTVGRWYWYGDTGLSPDEDYRFGFYEQVSRDLDNIAWNAPEYLIVKSAGNNRGEAPSDQPIEHYIWDNGWILATAERLPDGGPEGYDCLTPMSVAKNILTVGAVDDDKMMTVFSGFGPTDDGRIKPDVVAGGVDVYSSMGSSTSSYGTYSGTSMAAASATGSIALLQQLQEQLQPGVALRSSTLKGILIHTADEMGDSPGPDYQYGWGLMNMEEAAELIRLNLGSGGSFIREGMISEGESLIIPIETAVPASDLKVTLCWTDPPGTTGEPVLNSREEKLVNDLDLELIEVGSQYSHLSWELDPDTPGAPAEQKGNHRDNIEQVVVAGANPGIYHVKIDHSGTLEGGVQYFSLIISGIAHPSDIFPPHGLKAIAGESSVALKWDPPEEGIPDRYRIYRNDVALTTSNNNFFIDNDVETDIVYTYYITSVYEPDDIEYESVGSNRVTACPRLFRTLPHIIDFEEGHEDVTILNTSAGWLWGDSDSLSCYYLRFDENNSNFIAANSYTYGKVTHVKDIAATMPLKMGGHTDVGITFDYFFITGRYDAIDEMHVLYKLPGDEEWQILEQLQGTDGWITYSVLCPDEICLDGTQIGFYYDDMYEWGFGAGLDNIEISGSATRTVDFGINAMTYPVSSCSLTDDEPVILSIRNMGVTEALPGDVITLMMQVSTGTEMEQEIVLGEVLPPGETLSYQWPGSVDLSEPGSYMFDFQLFSELDKNKINNTFSSTITVSETVDAAILNEDLHFCEDDAPVAILVSPPGGILAGPGITGQFFDPAEVGPGTYVITYTPADQDACSDPVTAEFEVNPVPEPSIQNGDLHFCEDDAPVEILVNPPGGILTGPGITGLFFDPEEAGTGTHVITYNWTDPGGCSGSDTAEFEVNPVPEPSIQNGDLHLCENDSPIEILVNPSGGLLDGDGITGQFFDPAAAGIGSHLITYTLTNPEGCSASATVEVEVNPVPEPAILNGDLYFCEDEDPVLIQVSPPGGVLTGPGISGSWFDPASAGVGTHLITYTLTNTAGCTGSVSVVLTVTALPRPIIITPPQRFCRRDPSIQLKVEPLGGILSGPGVNDLIFNPYDAGPGLHICSYTYRDVFGCRGSANVMLEVVDNPEVNLGPDLEVGLDDTIELEPAGNGSAFLWYNGSTESTLSVITNDLGTGEFSLWVEAISLDNCKTKDSIFLTITSSLYSPEESQAEDFNIYPNPFSDGFYLDIKRMDEVEGIILTGTSGKIYLDAVPETLPYIAVPNLPDGYYILTVLCKDRNYSIGIMKR